jgi:hypothetical protein
MLDYKLPNIASGATPIGSAERAPDRDEIIKYRRCRRISIQNFDYVVKKMERDYSHQERRRSIQNLKFFDFISREIWLWIWDSRVALSQQNSNAVIYHEGKTPGSVLCGLVYAHGCALLVCIRVYDAKKILVDALGTLRTPGIHSL